MIMTMLTLTFPNISHKSEYLEMIAEWKSTEPTPTSPDTLFKWEDFEDFLQIITQEQDNPPDGKVPATLFFLMKGERILGAIHIHHHINHPRLMEAWWHIGYGIRPSQRRKWYATGMLRLGLIKAKELWIEKVLLGCHDDNIASQKTIERNGGIFERYTEHEGKKLRRYWIPL